MTKLGEAFVELRSKSSRFGPEAQAEVSRAVDAIKAAVGLTADSTGLRRDVTAAAEAAEAGQRIEIPVDVDRRPLDGLRGALAEASFEIDRIGGPGGRGRMLAMVLTTVATAGPQAAGGIASLGSAGVAAAAGLAPLVGLLGALPGLLGGVGLGAGALFLGLGGVGEAVQALGEESKAAGKAATDHAEAVEAAARRVRDAGDQLADARRRQAEVAAAAPERITAALRNEEQAEYRLTMAQRTQRQAQQDLTQARIDAVRRLEDMVEAVSDGALSEEQALISLERAREAVARAEQDAGLSDLDRRQVLLDLARAEDNLSDVQRQRARTAEDARRGVEGAGAAAQREAAATRAVTEAVEGLRLARLEVGNTERDVARDQVDAARDVARAQEGLTIALREQAKAGQAVGSAADKARTALEGLSPAAAGFARYLDSLRPLIRGLRADVGAALIPGLQEGLERLVAGTFPVFRQALIDTGRGIGDFVRDLGTLVAEDSFVADLRVILGSSIDLFERLGDATLVVIDGLRHVSVAAAPMVKALGDIAVEAGKVFRDAAAAGRESGSLTGFFDKAAETLRLVLSLTFHVGRALANLMRAAEPLGTDVIEKLRDVAKHLADISGTAEGQGRLAAFFEQMRPVMGALAHFMGRFVEEFFRLVTSTDYEPLVNALNSLADKALPAIVDALIKIQPLTNALLDLITALTSNPDFMKGLVDGVGLVAGPLAEIVKGITWLIDNVPGADSAMGTLFGTIIAFKLLRGFANPVIAGIRAISRALATEGLLSKFDSLRKPIGPPDGPGGGTGGGGGGGGGGAGGGGVGLCECICECLKNLGRDKPGSKAPTAAPIAAPAAAGVASTAAVAAGAVALVLAQTALFTRLTNRLFPGQRENLQGGVDAVRLIPGVGRPVGTALGKLTGVSTDTPAPGSERAAARDRDPAVRFLRDLPGTLAAADRAVGRFAQALPGRISGAFSSAARAVARFAQQLPGQLASGFTRAVTAAGRALEGLPGRAGRALGLALGTIARFGVQAGSAAGRAGAAIIGGILRFVTELPGRVGRLLGRVPGAVARLVPEAGGAAGRVGAAIIGGVTRFVNELPGKVAGFFGRLPGVIRDAIRDAARAAVDLGLRVAGAVESGLAGFVDIVRRVVTGAINAIKGGIRGVYEAARDFAKNLWQGFKDGLDMKSPSNIERAMTRIVTHVAEATGQLGGNVDRVKGFTTALGAAPSYGAAFAGAPAGVAGGAASDTFGPFVFNGIQPGDLPTELPRQIRAAQYRHGRQRRP